MWRLILQETFGPVNYLLGLVGLPSLSWVSSPQLALNSILIADIWQWTPFMILILYTGRLAINENQIAALSTLAMLPVIVIALLMQRRLVRGLTLGAVKG